MDGKFGNERYEIQNRILHNDEKILRHEKLYKAKTTDRLSVLLFQMWTKMIYDFTRRKTDYHSSRCRDL